MKLVTRPVGAVAVGVVAEEDAIKVIGNSRLVVDCQSDYFFCGDRRRIGAGQSQHDRVVGVVLGHVEGRSKITTSQGHRHRDVGWVRGGGQEGGAPVERDIRLKTKEFTVLLLTSETIQKDRLLTMDGNMYLKNHEHWSRRFDLNS